MCIFHGIALGLLQEWAISSWLGASLKRFGKVTGDTGGMTISQRDQTFGWNYDRLFLLAPGGERNLDFPTFVLLHYVKPLLKFPLPFACISTLKMVCSFQWLQLWAYGKLFWHNLRCSGFISTNLVFLRGCHSSICSPNFSSQNSQEVM